MESLEDKIKRLEAELAESQLRLDLIGQVLEKSQAGVIVLDKNLQIVCTNPIFESLFQISREELAGQDYRDIVATHMKSFFSPSQGFIENILTTLKTNTFIEDFECQIPSKTPGEIRWIKINSHPIDSGLHAGGRIEYFYDISEHKKTEQELRISEIRTTALLEGSPVCNKILDLDSNLQYMSSAGVGMLKIDNIEPFYGSKFPPDFYPEETKRVLNESFTIGKNGKITTVEVPAVNIHGEEVWFETTFVPARDKQGQIEFMIVTSVDITERKHTERENQALERQIHHAQKLESLGVLAGGIAHDFNNLLMSILGNANLALYLLPPDSRARDNLIDISETARKASELSNQMLVYAGKGRFKKETIHVGELLEAMAQLLKVSISKKATFELNLSAELPSFEGSPTQINQVIMNLITNASEALGEKSGTIQLSTGVQTCDRAYLDKTNEVHRAGLKEELTEGDYVYLEVSDNGIGMDEVTLQKIFDPFFTTKFTGRGLGMSAVLGILYAHKGTLKIRSSPGQGTTFRVLFPANKQLDANPVNETLNQSNETLKGTLLFVDDDEKICKVNRQMLQILGFNVLIANDGLEALNLYKKHANDIECVILDLTMPKLDGKSTFKEIRAINPEARVLLCSGFNDEDTFQYFEDKNLNGFIQKPYNMDELKEILSTILKVKQTV